MYLASALPARPNQVVMGLGPGQSQPHQRLGEALVAAGKLRKQDLEWALNSQKDQNILLGEILSGAGLVSKRRVAEEVASQLETLSIDLSRSPEDLNLTVGLDASECMSLGFLPWRRLPGVTPILVRDPAQWPEIVRRLPPSFRDPIMVLVEKHDLDEAFQRAFPETLVDIAENALSDAMSCRNWSPFRTILFMLAFTSAMVGLANTSPDLMAAAILGLSVVVLALNTTLKFTCILTSLRGQRPRTKATGQQKNQKISLLVPLLNETDIADRLLQRLQKLKYPEHLLEIVLIVEASDHETNQLLRRHVLPKAARIIRVPDGIIKTKPRAMNYALQFCHGQIIGIYDAEDEPDPDQLGKVATHFDTAPPNVACVQGALSYYNPLQNWLSRCFFFEYAAWFRIILPGLVNLGCAIPLGGTTVFFRRDILEKIGGWDAHNVTEDADLGIRLARLGYRTEIVETVTKEEANSKLWPWIKQRSRWLKGYAITWAVHSRRPFQLMRDLGFKKFLAFQILFLGTLLGFFLAPVLWAAAILAMVGSISASALPFGITSIYALLPLFLLAELISFAAFFAATVRLSDRPALVWIATLPCYFPLCSLALLKALVELMTRPFYWDKTQHGHFNG